MQYRKSIEKYFEPYQKQYLEAQATQPTSHVQPSTMHASELDITLASQLSLQPETNRLDELTQYLRSSMLSPLHSYFLLLIFSIGPTKPRSPCEFWKENEHNFPALASLARDVLAIPATGSGVEQLFNSARDICHYRRGSLKSGTIQDLMMFMCTSRFEIESEQLALMEEYVSTQEVQTKTEEKAANKVRDPEFDPISDTEEDPSGILSQPTRAPGAVMLGKRPRQAAPLIDLEEDDDDEDGRGEEEGNEEDEVPLPDNTHLHDQSSTQRRTSGRVPKRSKRDDGQWEYIKP